MACCRGVGVASLLLVWLLSVHPSIHPPIHPPILSRPVSFRLDSSVASQCLALPLPPATVAPVAATAAAAAAAATVAALLCTGLDCRCILNPSAPTYSLSSSASSSSCCCLGIWRTSLSLPQCTAYTTSFDYLVVPVPLPLSPALNPFHPHLPPSPFHERSLSHPNLGIDAPSILLIALPRPPPPSVPSPALSLSPSLSVSLSLCLSPSPSLSLSPHFARGTLLPTW
ncbi:hypothetical protein K431DRAFT_159142 [Polychaeton citri CBS 116435]|uniref:Uncharacterized protein n=1 Tax=Polychaeton citri CBS 116435 TaxID=1314669 RepID=A0A9P4PYK3_9PEZI|nr:hypothetical protein K431DRAFT_159142 [Polychaeton citri CBS 116435]